MGFNFATRFCIFDIYVKNQCRFDPGKGKNILEMSAPRLYNATANCLITWAKSELEHIGRIVALEDKDIQYSYAMSTLNGMAHLKDAIYEYISKNPENPHTSDLQITHDKVIRAMKHLIKDFDLNTQEIVDFNTRKVLSNLSYLNGGKRKTRKSYKR